MLLEAIAEGWHVALTDEQTSEIVDLLIAAMSDPVWATLVVQKLGNAEREALGHVAALGTVRAHVLQRKFGTLRRLGPGRLEWEDAWRHPASPTERLWFLGLLFREYSKDRDYHGEVFYVAPEVLTALPALPADLPRFRLVPAPASAVRQDDGDALARDAFLLLSYVRRRAIRSRKAGWSLRVGSELHSRLAGPEEPERLLLLERLCARAGWLAQDEGVWRPTARAAGWMKKGSVARQRQMYDAWRLDKDWNELLHIPGLRCEDTGWRSNPRLAREAMARHLLACPVGAWHTIDSFVSSLKDVDPDLMRPDGDYDSWYVRSTRTDSYLTGFAHWDDVEGAVIRHLLERPLRWLGIVALAASAPRGRVDCFSLTPLGYAVLNRPTAASKVLPPDGAGRQSCLLIVRPDLRVIVPPGGSWYDRWLLGRFSRWAGEREGAMAYRLDAASVRACLAEGITLRQITAFLKRASGDRVPQQVVEALQLYARGKN